MQKPGTTKAYAITTSNKYPKAISAYNKSVEIDSTLKKQHYYNNIGTAYAKNNQFAAAKEAFTQYQKLFPNEGRPYRNWAMYHALQNQKEESSGEFENSNSTRL
jgi:Flp pilus assembly protein TadD